MGIFKVESGPFEDDSPIFTEKSDPFIVRFKVIPEIWLELNKSIPIKEDELWKELSFTKDHDKNSSTWTGKLRSSLSNLSNQDAEILIQYLNNQANDGRTFELTDSDLKKLRSPTVKTQANKEVAVSIPEDYKETSNKDLKDVRESIKIQALLAEVGSKMNMKIWIPRSDRERVKDLNSRKELSLIDRLPMNYDDTTLKTIENIDVIWIIGRSIIRAFEVEHTTSIYSGILRMADLMALQPNLDIKAHIVAPEERKEKVFQEITRPVFALLEKGPLYESCSFISYDSVIELSREKRLKYMSDEVLEEYMEIAETS